MTRSLADLFMCDPVTRVGALHFPAYCGTAAHAIVPTAQVVDRVVLLFTFLLLIICAVGTKSASAQASIGQEIAIAAFVSYGPSKEQTFDVYYQRRVRPDAAKAPIILVVHGGAWRMGDKAARGVVQNKVDHWVSKGLVVISVNYRLLPEANPLQQAEDVARALATVQARAHEWGGDASKVILLGHSAGGHLVSLLNARPARAYSLGAQPWLGTVSLDSAALDVEAIMRAPHLRGYDDAFGASPNALWKEASPAAVVAAGVLPTLLVCSTVRRPSPCEQAERYAERVRAVGGRAQVLPVELNHLQINSELGARKPYTQSVDRFLSQLDPLVAARLAN